MKIQASSVAYDLGSDGPVVGHTSGSSQTDLAKQLAPPRPPSYPGFFKGCGHGCLVIVLLSVLGSIMPGNPGIALLALALFVYAWAARSGVQKTELEKYAVEQQNYREQMASWQQLWFCHTCGTTYSCPEGSSV